MKYRRIIGICIALLIFYFIGNIIHKEWDKISRYNWSPHLVWFIPSVGILIFVYYMSACGWTLVLRMIGVRIGWGKGAYTFLLSIFGRYVPGGVWAVLGRIYLCRLEGIPDSRSSIGLLLEQAYQVVSAVLVFAISLLFWDDTASVFRLIPVITFLPLFIVFLHPRPFLKIANPILSRFGKGPINISLSFNNMLILTFYYLLYWGIVGVAFYFFINAFYPIDIYYIPILSGVYAISFTIGYLTFFTPAGLGVREGSLAILLSLFIPAPVAIGVSLLSRLWLIGVEILILLAFLINTETRKMARTAIGW